MNKKYYFKNRPDILKVQILCDECMMKWELFGWQKQIIDYE